MRGARGCAANARATHARELVEASGAYLSRLLCFLEWVASCPPPVLNALQVPAAGGLVGSCEVVHDAVWEASRACLSGLPSGMFASSKKGEHSIGALGHSSAGAAWGASSASRLTRHFWMPRSLLAREDLAGIFVALWKAGRLKHTANAHWSGMPCGRFSNASGPRGSCGGIGISRDGRSLGGHKRAPQIGRPPAGRWDSPVPQASPDVLQLSAPGEIFGSFDLFSAGELLVALGRSRLGCPLGGFGAFESGVRIQSPSRAF